MIYKIYLGESLSTLTSALRESNPQHVIIDLWDGGSLLSSIEICGMEVDKAPLLAYRVIPTVESITIHPHSVFIGSESSYAKKVSKNVHIQKNWLLELSKGGKIPRNFFHSLYKKLRSEAINRRIYDTIKKVELGNRRITLLRYGTLNYEKLMNSLPLPYIVGKTDLRHDLKNAFLNLDYVSLLTGISVARAKVDEYTILYVGKNNLVPHTVVLIPLKIFEEGLSDYILIYSITSIKRPYVNYRGEYVNRLLNDVKKLGLGDMKPLCSKLIFEKFGLLGSVSADFEAVIDGLRDYDVEPLGRLGTWREVSIDDVLNHAGIR